VLSKALVLGVTIDGASDGLSNVGQSQLNPTIILPLNSAAQAGGLVHPGMRQSRQSSFTGRAKVRVVNAR